VPHEPTPGLPGDRQFGRVTYRAPRWAFEDARGRERESAIVSWGRSVFSFSNPHTLFDVHEEACVDGQSTYAPEDTFCSLYVGEGDPLSGGDGLGHLVPVNTFGLLVERLVRDGSSVAPGDSLFVFEARPPSTSEWFEQYEAARKESREAAELRRVLRGGPLSAARWMWHENRRQRRARKLRVREGQQALKEHKAEQARARKERGS
jgi:hypothetical protein